MSDTVLFLTGLSVFGLMIIAIIMTVVEFREMQQRRRNRAKRTD